MNSNYITKKELNLANNRDTKESSSLYTGNIQVTELEKDIRINMNNFDCYSSHIFDTPKNQFTIFSDSHNECYLIH